MISVVVFRGYPIHRPIAGHARVGIDITALERITSAGRALSAAGPGWAGLGWGSRRTDSLYRVTGGSDD